MHLVSTLNPRSATETNIPVAIFRCNGRRKFLQLLNDYKDMLSSVSNAFNLRDQLFSLQTSSLDACEGENVEIDQSAYPFMLAVLDIVDVIFLPQEHLVNPEQHRDTDEGSLVSFPTRPPSISETPSNPPSRESSHRPEDNEHEHPHHSDSPLPPNSEDDEEQEVEEMDEFTAVPEATQMKDVPYSREIGVGYSTGKWNIGPVIAENWPTPVRPKFKPVSKPATPAATNDVSTYVKKEKEAASDPLPQVDPPSTTTKPPRRPMNTADPAINPDSHFEISIMGPGLDQIAQFKTRGRHSVSKVLGVASKYFGLDSNQARLFYLDTWKDDEDKEHTEHIKCELEDTMAQYSAITKLYIKIKQDPLVEAVDDELLKFD